MKKSLLFAALLLTTINSQWNAGILPAFPFSNSAQAQTTYRLDSIPVGWTVTVNGTPVTVTPYTGYDSQLGYVNAAAGATIGVGPSAATQVCGVAVRKRIFVNGHECIAMNDSVLFALTNIGANSEHQIGNYYAWGETTPKTNFTWDNYAFGNIPNGTCIRYNGNDSVLLPGDDAARASWSAPWRTPTTDEWFYSLFNTSFTHTVVSNYKGTGVKGLLITCNGGAYKGNSIFLPATGAKANTSLDYPDEGIYWTASLAPFDVDYSCYDEAEAMSFYTNGTDLGSYIETHMERAMGAPVRAFFVDETLAQQSLTSAIYAGNNIWNFTMPEDGAVLRATECRNLSLAWSNSEGTFYLDMGDQGNAIPRVMGSANVALHYGSSNPSVASVNDAGDISYNQVGTTTIYAVHYREAGDGYDYDSASFTLHVLTPDTLRVVASPSTKGSVRVIWTTATVRSLGSGKYCFIPGTRMAVEARPNEHCNLTSWSDGSALNAENTDTITPIGNTTLTAYFNSDGYLVRTMAYGPQMGTVNGKSDTTFVMQGGESIQLVATPVPCHHLIAWSTYATDNTITFTPTSDTTIIAIFEKDTPVTGDTTVTEQESFTWHGSTYFESGTYYVTLTSANGCDSIVAVHLTILSPQTQESRLDSIPVGWTVTVNGSPRMVTPYSGDDSYLGYINTVSGATISVMPDDTTQVCGVAVRKRIFVNGHECIAMNDSVLFALTNIGASSEHQIGDYYAWGETTPKNAYTWESYSFGHDPEGSFSRYTGNDYTVLRPENDAAQVNWGAPWHTPTEDDLVYALFTPYYTRSVTTNYKGTGVSGMIFTRKTGTYQGNTIFLPATGFMDHTTLNIADNGFYWTSELSSTASRYANVSRIYTDGSYLNYVPLNLDRSAGAPVRAIVIDAALAMQSLTPVAYAGNGIWNFTMPRDGAVLRGTECKDPVLTWSAAEATVYRCPTSNLGSLPRLSAYATSIDLHFGSSDTSVATINSAGRVVFKDAGTTSIYVVHYRNAGDGYAYDSAAFTLHVVNLDTLRIVASPATRGSVELIAPADSVVSFVYGYYWIVPGTKVVVKATPNDRCYLSSWSDGTAVNAAGTDTVIVRGSMTITAFFAADSYQVSVAPNDPTMGSAVVTHDGNSYSSLTVGDGDSVRLVATPVPCHYFVGWSNGATSDTLVIVPTGDVSLTAIFEKAVPAKGDTTVVAYDSLNWNGTTYTESGFYYDTLTAAAANGCDSIVTSHLIIIPPYTLEPRLDSIPISWTVSVDGTPVNITPYDALSMLGYVDISEGATVTVVPDDTVGVCGVKVRRRIFVNGHECIAMTDSLLFALTNIGADSAHQIGNYYAWGETTPKSTFTWNNYRFGNILSGTCTRYVGTDTLTLLPEDDAARMNWGEPWRMPTVDDWNQIFDPGWWVYDWERDSNYRGSGVMGFVCTSRQGDFKGNNFFLPASGIYRNNLTSVNDTGACWTASIIDTTIRASKGVFAFPVYGYVNVDRCIGLPVRPVIKSDSLVRLTLHPVEYTGNGSWSFTMPQYGVVVNPAECKHPGLTWMPTGVTIYEGREWIQPVLENPAGVAVRYGSLNPQVATIDDTGAITLHMLGSATLYAVHYRNSGDGYGYDSTTLFLRAVPIDTLTLMASPDTNGTVALIEDIFVPGDTIYLDTLTGDYTVKQGDVLTGRLRGNYQITADGDVDLMLSGVIIDYADADSCHARPGLSGSGDVTIYLAEGTENYVRGAHGHIYPERINEYEQRLYSGNPGIFVYGLLTIRGTGSLTAVGNGYQAAGIQVGYDNDVSLMIESGNITAIGGEKAPGIGDALFVPVGRIVINGGHVIALGGRHGAGIGGGSESVIGHIAINGGSVLARGGALADGIGISHYSYYSNCEAVTIAGSATKVTAIAGGVDDEYYWSTKPSALMKSHRYYDSYYNDTVLRDTVVVGGDTILSTDSLFTYLGDGSGELKHAAPLQLNVGRYAVARGAEVVAKGMPNEHYHVSGWSDGTLPDSGLDTIDIDTCKTVTVFFEINQHRLDSIPAGWTVTADSESVAVTPYDGISGRMGYVIVPETSRVSVMPTHPTWVDTLTVAVNEGGHAYVDMGDGLLWGTCNVGADSVYHTGDYYAWGEVETQYDTLVPLRWKPGIEYYYGYRWPHYRWSNFNGRATRYKGKDYTTLRPEDDAAHRHWGFDWRIPTYGEWEALSDTNNYDWTWTNNYNETGVKGMVVTSKMEGYEGNSIFLPSSNSDVLSSLNNSRAGDPGFYWSSTLGLTPMDHRWDNAGVLYISPEGVKDTFALRCNGQSVRPVVLKPDMATRGTDGSWNFTMSSVDVHLNVVQHQEYLTRVVVNDTAMGSAQVTYHSISDTSLFVIESESALMFATPSNCYHFVGWSNGATTDTIIVTPTSDTTIVANFERNAPLMGDTANIVCDSFYWHGIVYTASGSYNDTLLNAATCDSVVTLNLTVNHSTTSDTSATSCDSLFWRGYNYTASGSYHDTLTNAVLCDSIITLQLTVNYSVTTDTLNTVCDNFYWHGTNYTASGSYSDSLSTVHGCDSVVVLQLTVNYSNTGDTTATVCDNLLWYGNSLVASCDTTHVLQNVAACDSTVTLHLTVNYQNTGDTNAVEYSPFTWYEHVDMDSTQQVTHLFAGANQWGCDSTVTLHLKYPLYTTLWNGDTTVVYNALPQRGITASYVDDAGVLQSPLCIYRCGEEQFTAPDYPVNAGTYTVTAYPLASAPLDSLLVDTFTFIIMPATVQVVDVEVEQVKFEDGTANVTVTDTGRLEGLQGRYTVGHTVSAAYAQSTPGFDIDITMTFTLTGDSLGNYLLDSTSRVLHTGVILERFVTDGEGIVVDPYGYCWGDGTMNYDLLSGNPDQYRVDFADPSFPDMDWTDIETPGTLVINVPEGAPTGDYSATLQMRNHNYPNFLSDTMTVNFHVDLPQALIQPLFYDLIALIDTCHCMTDVQWYHRGVGETEWVMIPGANDYFCHEEGGLTGEYRVRVKIDGVENYSCPQSDIYTLLDIDPVAAGEAPVLKVYPNPTSAMATVEVRYSSLFTHRSSLTHSLKVMNVMGVELERREFRGERTVIDLSDYPMGQYIVSIDGAVIRIVRK